jgi:hypothetical protein
MFAFAFAKIEYPREYWITLLAKEMFYVREF